MKKIIFEKTYQIDFNAEPKPRNVFILLDGTWNDETGKEENKITTNIYKMYQLLADDSPEQIKRYFRGVGNDEGNSFWGRIFQGAFGSGEKKIRENAYATVCKDFSPGDKIFIFGFSRGAACARMLASDLNKKGIPEEIKIKTKPSANKQSKNIEYDFLSYESSEKTHKVDVQFLGVWDTVFAFGIPVKLFGIPFHKYDLFKDKLVSSNVKNTVHILAIDETRDPFQPTLMNYDPDRIHEVWFPGVHSDVGGGYYNDEAGRITLNYMLKKLDECCGKNDLDPVQYNLKVKEDLTGRKKENIVLHFHGLKWKKSVRDIHILRDNNPDREILPNVHISLQHTRTDANAFSRQVKKSWFRKPKESLYRIVYNPPGIRLLKQKYKIVE